MDKRERLLIEAPTGSGKTLISQLAIGMLAEELKARLPRVLVVVPTRSLLIQHIEDASWVGHAFGLGIHRLESETTMSLFEATMRAFGVMYTTPVTLRNRLSALPNGSGVLAGFDMVVFDEIDTYLTVDELEERRDTWRALQMCLDAGLPTLGFTGTHLTEEQMRAWTGYGFAKTQADVPEDWLPFTRVQFVPVDDRAVRLEDNRIREEMRQAYRSLINDVGPSSWSAIRRLAQRGEPGALKILGLCGERLRLFESPNHLGAKLAAIRAESTKRGPTLVLSRFRDTARFIEQAIAPVVSTIVRADGSMHPADIGFAMNQFRTLPGSARGALVITRELGGRGLDFPSAARVLLVSPRSNYQAVAQELARIRSRKGKPKTALITYFADTEEEAKARRLGLHLSSETFGESALFKVIDMPPSTYTLEPFEGRTLVYEESLAPA